MAYRFTFDLSKVRKNFVKEVTEISLRKGFHKKLSTVAKRIVKTLNLEKVTGLPFTQILEVVEDILEIQRMNLEFREKFEKAKKKALLLPHCARKYMDSRCKARFDGISYYCRECSKNCLIRKAKKLAEKKGYDVFILPGGSCIPKILEKGYDGILGVACSNEIKLAGEMLKKYKNIAIQALPLLKNGCSKTIFDINLLRELL